MAQTLIILCLWLLSMSIIVATLYGWDKWRATRNRWRVSELALHLGELLGGWPGALVAGHIFRHKTYKRSFRLVRAGCIMLNVVLLAAMVMLLQRSGLQS